MSQDSDTPPLLSGAQILVRVSSVDGAGSGLDADTVRGRAGPADVFIFPLAPPFTPPPLFGDTVAQSLFGV